MNVITDKEVKDKILFIRDVIQFTQDEKDEVAANCDHLKNLRFSYTLPKAFIEKVP